MSEESHITEAQLPLDSVGVRLRRAREVAGLSRADVAERTKIAERHLQSIEEDRFRDLASSTYAVGFARTYARSVGLDEHAIARDVRSELAENPNEEPRYTPAAFEPGDPARVPGSRTAWIAALGAMAVVAIVFALWRSYYAPSVDLPDLTAEPVGEAPSDPASSAMPSAPAVPAGDQGQQVVFTATENAIWVKFYDVAGTQLMQKQMALGETYAVPLAAAGPQIWTARPDALTITVGGKPVPPLADRQTTLKNVPVSAAAILARPPAPPASQPAGLPSVAASPLAPIMAVPQAQQTSTVSN